ncbi:MAG: hypothetical protein AAFQ42_02855 [Pseudomonadota bacterium]
MREWVSGRAEAGQGKQSDRPIHPTSASARFPRMCSLKRRGRPAALIIALVAIIGGMYADPSHASEFPQEPTAVAHPAPSDAIEMAFSGMPKALSELPGSAAAGATYVPLPEQPVTAARQVAREQIFWRSGGDATRLWATFAARTQQRREAVTGSGSLGFAVALFLAMSAMTAMLWRQVAGPQNMRVRKARRLS